MSVAGEERVDRLRRVALQACRELRSQAHELRQIEADSLPRNASGALRTHLRDTADRIEDTAELLEREVDRPNVERRFVKGLSALGKVAVVGLASVSTAVVSGVAEGGASTLVAHRLENVEATVVQRLQEVEQECAALRSRELVSSGVRYDITHRRIFGNNPAEADTVFEGITTAAEFSVEPAFDESGVVVKALPNGGGVRATLPGSDRPFIINEGASHVLPGGSQILATWVRSLSLRTGELRLPGSHLRCADCGGAPSTTESPSNSSEREILPARLTATRVGDQR